MKNAKLVTGILCMVFTFLVLLQSCAAGVANTIGDTGEVSGSAGLLLAILMLAGGIIEVATRKSEKVGGLHRGIDRIPSRRCDRICQRRLLH